MVYGIVHSILLGGFSGTIIQKLRDNEGLIYWANLGRNTFKQDVRYMMFSTGCDKSKKDLVVEKIKRVLEDTITDLKQEDIDRTIPIKIYNQKVPPNAYEDLSELMDSIIYETDYIQTEEYLKLLKSAKAFEVKNFMKKYFVEENSSTVFLD